MHRVHALVTSLLLVGAGADAVPQGRLPPRPVEIVTARDVAEGEVLVDPAVVVVTARPGEAAQPEFSVDSGVDGTVIVALSVAELVPGEDGAPTPAPSRAGGAATWVTLPTDEVFLERGERALVRPAVDVPVDAEDADQVVALLAEFRRQTGEGTATAVSYLVIEVSAESPDADVTLDVVAGGAPRVRLSVSTPTGRAAVVSGRVDLGAWWGGGSSVSVPTTVALPDSTRVLEVGVGSPVLPGRYELTASLRTEDGDELTAATSAWLWSARGAAATLLALLALAVALLLARRRLRR